MLVKRKETLRKELLKLPDGKLVINYQQLVDCHKCPKFVHIWLIHFASLPTVNENRALGRLSTVAVTEIMGRSWDEVIDGAAHTTIVRTQRYETRV